MHSIATRLNENLAIAKEAIDRLESSRPLLPEPDLLRDEALKLRLASMQLAHLAQALSDYQMEFRFQEDGKMKAANDDS